MGLIRRRQPIPDVIPDRIGIGALGASLYHSGMDLMAEIACDEVLDLAYDWLCRRRERTSHNNDVWDVRWRWADIKPRLRQQLLAGEYRLGPTRRLHCEQHVLEIWSALDALVLKATAIVLGRQWHSRLSDRCFHLAGRGGAKAAVRAVLDQLRPCGPRDSPGPQFVFRTDVKSYYASIDHDVLLQQLGRLIPDARVLGLVEQYVRHTVYDGLYETVTRGICLGCSLSPLMGAVYLQPVDDAMAKTGLFYARFMDDWVVLAPTHWTLRAAIRLVNQAPAALKVQQHPDKTFVGRISRGFDFLGYTFSTVGLTGIARKTVAGYVERMDQLYERGADLLRIGQYVRRWIRWVNGGVGGDWAGTRRCEHHSGAGQRDATPRGGTQGGAVVRVLDRPRGIAPRGLDFFS